MEFFTKSKAVRLRSHLDKYLFADEDEETVRQSKRESSHQSKWVIEIHEENQNSVIRLKSCFGKFLTATEKPFLLGMTGNKVLQIESNKNSILIDWVPIRDGFQVKLRTKRDGNYLRANGGTPPWRNSVTHDPSDQKWVLWDVELVDLTEIDLHYFGDYQSKLSRQDQFDDLPILSGSIISSPKFPSSKIGMELFRNAKVVRLKSHHDKYLVADEDEESVVQDRNGSSKTARWVVEFLNNQEDGNNFIRLKSCFGKYLTASNVPFLLGMTGRKILQTLPRRLDSSIEWEPIREGFQTKLKTRYGNFLRANGGLPPWRNSVTHDIPHRTSTQDWVLWDVDILEIQVNSLPPQISVPQKKQEPPNQNQNQNQNQHLHLPPEPLSPEPLSPVNSTKFSRLESSDSFDDSPPPLKVDGRMIYYEIADENGNIDEDFEDYSFIFKGLGVYELTRKLEEETGLEDIIVCTKSLLNGKLYPLRLQLPPNNGTMHVVVLQGSSKVAREF